MKVYPISSSMPAPASFESELTQYRQGNRDKLKTVHVRRYLRRITRATKYLSAEYDTKPENISRCALHIGIAQMWHMFDDRIKIIQDNRQLVYRRNRSLLDWFEKCSFDLQSSEHDDLTLNFDEANVGRAQGFGGKLGLSYSTVYQLGVMSGLLRATELLDDDNAFFYETYKRFIVWMNHRVSESCKIKNMAVMNPQASNKSAKRKSWQDIIDLDKTLGRPIP